MRQGRDEVGEHLPVIGHALRAHLQQIVEGPRDHVALLNLRHLQHGAVEGVQRDLSRVRQPHLHEGDVVAAQQDRIEERPVAPDHAVRLQSAQAGLGRRLGQADAICEGGHADAPVDRQHIQNFRVE